MMTPKSRFADLGFWQIPVIAGLIIVSFYPIEPVELKMQIIAVCVIGITFFFLRRVSDAINYRPFLILAGMVVSVLTYVLVSDIFRPPVNEYAANKLIYTYYVLIVFGILVPWVLYRAGGAIDLVAVLLLVSIFFGVISFFPTIESDNMRYSVIGLSPTMMSKLTLMTSILLAVYRRRLRAFLPIISFLFLFGVVATLNTGSRGSLIALAAAVGIFSVFRGRIREMLKFAVVLMVLALLVYVTLRYLPSDIQDRFTIEALSIQENSDEGDRIMLWQTAWDGIRHSFMGRGLGSFSLVSFIAAPHNVILEALYELGFPVGSVFLFYLFFPLFKIKGLIAREDWRIDFVCLAYLHNVIQSLYGGELSLSNSLFYLTTSMVWLIKPQKAVAPLETIIDRRTAYLLLPPNGGRLSVT